MKFNSGSQPIKPDPRDKKFTQIAFGAAALPEFPLTFRLPQKKIKNQGNSLACTAHATTLASEHQENRELSAAWHWMETCRRLGNFIPNGADPRTAMKISLELGDLPAELATYSFPETNPQIIGNWDQWPHVPEATVELYRKAAYVKIPKVGDYFDSVRAALMNQNAVMAFSTWCWGSEKFISRDPQPVNGYHAYTFVGWDIDYLIIQNSYGETWGENGLQWMPRETVNREFAKWGAGLYQFVDLTPDQIARAKELGVGGQIQRAILQIWYRLSELYGSIF